MISIIVAMDEKKGIGKENALMWRIPGELPRFRRITTGHPIIMGRKTFESIGRVLPNRKNIIITRDPDYTVDGAIVVNSLEKAIEIAQQEPQTMNHEPLTNENEVFIIGGGQIFKEAMEKGLIDKLYLTLVKGDFGADTFFPAYEKAFPIIIESEAHADDTYTYTFETRSKS